MPSLGCEHPRVLASKQFIACPGTANCLCTCSFTHVFIACPPGGKQGEGNKPAADRPAPVASDDDVGGVRDGPEVAAAVPHGAHTADGGS